MVFSSVTFIYIFLPVFLIVYYLIPDKWRNAALFGGSMVFYTIGSWEYPLHILVFFLCLLLNYLIGKGIAACDSKHLNKDIASKKRKVYLVCGIVLDVLNLFFFKYMSFIWEELSGTALQLILPIGISFYTFQAMSYLMDVYRGEESAMSFLEFGAYLAMFPQLIAGPIVTYPTVREDLRRDRRSMENLLSGAEVFILGLGSKVLLANQLAGLWRQCQSIGFESITTAMAWMGIVAYSFQLYFDFWGYSLMAVGLGRMLGFEFPANFMDPYMSVSMTEFWRRWHITLGSWFREYIYIPLGGSRKGKGRTFLNLFVIWMLTGIWHGAGYNFLLWGFALFVVMMIEKAGLQKFMEKHRWIGHIYMMVLVPLSWALFVNTDFSQLILFFQRLFASGNTIAVYAEDYLEYGRQYFMFLFLGFAFSTDIPRRVHEKIKGTLCHYLILLVIFWAVAYCLFRGMDDPFLYFQF